MRKMPCAVLFSLTVFAFSSVAQQPPPRDPRAVAILQQSLAAMGSLGNQDPTKGILVEGTFVEYFKDSPVLYPVRLKLLGPDRVRWEVEKPGGTVVTVVAGHGGWTKSAKGNKRLPVSQTPGMGLEYFPFLAILRWVSSPDYTAQDSGMEALAGRNHLRLSLGQIHRGNPDYKQPIEKTSQQELLLDSSTQLPAKLRYFEHAGDWRVRVAVELDYSDYRALGGILIPHKVTRTLQGRSLSELQVSKISFNVAIPDADFREN